jgi:ankyrin repeat protein
LHYAALKGDVDSIKLLLEHGANPLLRNKENKTPGALAIKSAIIRGLLFKRALEWNSKSVSSLGLFGQKQVTSVKEKECSSSLQLGINK